MSTSKTGKHGHAKVHLVAIDVRLLAIALVTRFLNSRLDFYRKEVGEYLALVTFRFDE